MSLSPHDRFSRLAALRPLEQPEKARGSSGAEFVSAFSGLPEGAARLAEILGAAPSVNHFGEHLLLRKWFSDPSECVPEESALRLLAPDAALEIVDPREWIFLDTETTGLMGGTGTYAFLVGIAWWDAGGLQVEQFFLRDHSEEYSLLEALAGRLAERRVLVTFNGKSFDWPLLETRYRMTRSVKVPQMRAHLDFLHPARNLWRMQIGSVRLADLERHVLGWKREGDVVSQMIPDLYFDYLRGGSPEPLVPIFYHNQLDLRGLAALANRTLSLLANPETHGKDALELFGVSRLCERRGQTGRARKLYQQSLEAELPPPADRAARRALARMARRDGNFSLAAELWESILGNSREGLEAYEQLAIYCERHARDAARAISLSRRALAEIRNASRLGLLTPVAYRKSRARWEHRLKRLERKTQQPRLDARGI